MKNGNGFRSIGASEAPDWARVALRAHRAATRKKRVELRRLNLPVIVWKNGKVHAVPA